MRSRHGGDLTLVTQYFPPERGAAQVRLGAIVSDLVRRGVRVEVVTSLPNYPIGRIFDGWAGSPLQVADERGATVRRVWIYAAMGSGVRRLANFISFGLMSLLGLVTTRRTPVVVVEYPTLFGAFPAVVLGALRRQTVVLIVADLWVDSIVEIGTLPDGPAVAFLRGVERWMLRRADVVTAVTEGVRAHLLDKGVPADRLAWLPNGADTELFHPGEPDPDTRRRHGLSPDDHIVLYAGTHGYVHGLDVVLDAADMLRGDPVQFVLVGDGSEKPDLLARAEELNLPNLRFLDPVAPEVVADLLRASTVALATVRGGDLYKTIRSAKMMPAMASGRPVVYSGEDEGAGLVADVGAGVVTPPGDATALAAAVRRLIGEPGLREDLGAAGRLWVVQNASWHRLVGEWLQRIAVVAGRSVDSSADKGGIQC